MNSNIIRSWNGKTIRQREDGYLSATDMCQSCGKRWNNWYQLATTKEYLKALENKHCCDSSNGELIDSKVGGSAETTGTWVHRKVALRLAQWLSPEFAVQVDEWIEELLLKGKVDLTQQPVQQLPPADIRVSNLSNALISVGIQLDNPRFKQGIQDLYLDILVIGSKQLSTPQETWLGVAERAEQLGYAPSVVVKNRSQLGKFVKACGLNSRYEKRLCNGTMRDINLYLQTEELDNSIREFLDAKILTTK